MMVIPVRSDLNARAIRIKTILGCITYTPISLAGRHKDENYILASDSNIN